MKELGIDFYDIAYYDGLYWFACNDTEYPVRLYNAYGTLVDSVSSSDIPAAHGMTFDENGFLWVSNMDTDEIYKIAVSNTPLTRSTWAHIKSSF